MRYRKKPVVIEAVQWNRPFDGVAAQARDLAACGRGHPDVRPTTYSEVAQLCGTSGCSKESPFWDWTVMGVMDTSEGKHVVSPGDWIITGVKGERYPCKPDIFEATYEAVP